MGDGEREKKKQRQQKKLENKAEPSALNIYRCLILHIHSFRKWYLPSTCLEPGIILAHSFKKPPVPTLKRELLCMALRGECMQGKNGRTPKLPHSVFRKIQQCRTPVPGVSHVMKDLIIGMTNKNASEVQICSNHRSLFRLPYRSTIGFASQPSWRAG